MPLPFYIISMFVPATYFINITRGIILRGAGLRHLWFDGLMLTIMGALLFFAAARPGVQRVVVGDGVRVGDNFGAERFELGA